MSDPRFTDQRSTDPRSTDPNFTDPNFIVPEMRNESTGGVWGWIAGFAVIALIAFVVIAGWNNGGNENQASSTSTPAPITTGNSGPVRNVTPPGTTGSGSNSSLTNPATPNPAAPNATPAPAPSQQ
jgi:hypothetical protein